MKNRSQEPLVRVTWLRESTVTEALPSLGSMAGRLTSRLPGTKTAAASGAFTPENITRWLVQTQRADKRPQLDAITASLWARLKQSPTADELRAVSEIWNEAVRQKTITYVEWAEEDWVTSTVQAGWVTYPIESAAKADGMYAVRLYVLVRDNPPSAGSIASARTDMAATAEDTPVPYYSSHKRETAPGGKEVGYVIELTGQGGDHAKFSKPLGANAPYPLTAPNRKTRE